MPNLKQQTQSDRPIITTRWLVLYLLHGPPPSPPGRAPRPGSSSSSAHVWRGSMATCLRAAPPWSQTGMGTVTPPTSRSGRTARWGRSARWGCRRRTTPSRFRGWKGKRTGRSEDKRWEGWMDGRRRSGAAGREGEKKKVKEMGGGRGGGGKRSRVWKKYKLYNS